MNGATLVDTTLRVVAKRSQIRNRTPFPVATKVSVSGGLAQCSITSAFAVRDPDFDVVSYRYRWTAGGKVLRSVTSAMLSDIVRVPSGSTPTCSVVAHDVH